MLSRFAVSRRFLRIGLLSFSVLSARAVFAQDPRAESTRAALQGMARFAWLAGEWEGPATVTNSGRTFTLTQRETVRATASGTALLIEGRGSMRMAPNEPERQVFAAAGLLTYDVPSKRHQFFSVSGSGQAQSFTIELIGDEGFVWGYTDGAGQRVRYTIRRTPAGAWHEVGESSADGTTWAKTLEMTLTRKGTP